MAGREGQRSTPARRVSSFRNVALLMLIPILGLIVLFAYSFVRTAIPTRVVRASAVTPSVSEGPGRPGGTTIPAPPIPQAPRSARGDKSRGDIVLILDDVGFDHQPLVDAMRIDPNLNFAVLPNGSRSADFARELDGRGFELLCHLPMEPVDYPHTSPGPHAILTSMTDDEIVKTTRENVAAVPHARGVNNHMGSRATADPRVMTSVLGALPKGMYFIDSRTTGDSIAARTAHAMNVRTASRSVFLDDVQTEPAIRRQLAALSAAAAEHGVAVGIGHMYPQTVRVLREEAPELRTRGFRFVRASTVVN